MAILQVTVSDDPVAKVTGFNPKPGDVFWIKYDETAPQGREEMHQLCMALNSAVEMLGLQGQVAIIVTVAPHDLKVLGDDEMERLGWVRKKGTS